MPLQLAGKKIMLHLRLRRGQLLGRLRFRARITTPVCIIYEESPLTLSLSPWERERLLGARVASSASPLPWGEGQGEG